jgi:hypothetical protein
MADVPILLCILGALAAIDRWCRLGCPFGGGAFWLAIAAITLCYSTKPQTIVLIALPLVHYAVNRHVAPGLSAKRVIAFCCLACVPFAAWAARGAWLERAGYRQEPQIYYVSPRPPSDEGAGWAGVHLSDAFGRPAPEILRATVDNAKWRLFPNLAEQVVPLLALTRWRMAPVPGWAALLVSAILLFPVGVGWITQWRDRESLITSFYALHALTVLTATYFANPRFLVCLIPFTFFFFLVGMETMVAKRWVLRSSSAALLVLGAAALIAHIDGVRRQPYATPAQAAFVDAASWSKRSLEADAAILGHNWSELHVLSGLSTYPMLSPPGVSLEPWLEISARPVYVLVPKADALAAISARDKCPASWRLWLAEHPGERSLVFENAFYRIERLNDLPFDVVMGGADPSGGRGAS